MINKQRFAIFVLILSFASCSKNEEVVIYDAVKTIEIAKGISVDNGARINNPTVNFVTYEDFLKYLVSSKKFLIVTQEDFAKTTSTDKIVISLRHDVDENINSAIKMAYRERKYGVRATYFILHTANYYGETRRNYFKRNDKIIHYLKKIQDSFGHEIGWHSDLVTLQVIYNQDPKQFLKTELEWLRSNGIRVNGTVAHGREFCYEYHYVNSYFWLETQGTNEGKFYNWEYIPVGDNLIKIEKDSLTNYKLYDANQIKFDLFYADAVLKGKRWYMGMVDFDSIPLGSKVIILTHPQWWD